MTTTIPTMVMSVVNVVATSLALSTAPWLLLFGVFVLIGAWLSAYELQ